MRPSRLLALLFVTSLLFSSLSVLPAEAQSSGPYKLRLPLVLSPGASSTFQRENPTLEWILTFEDHFNGTALNRQVWSSDYSNGVNGELQQYVADESRGNYVVKDGVLNIIAKREAYLGRSYTSGVIISRDRFYQKYGKFEMRARLPAGQGLWPAFWLLPNPSGWPPEIDMMEHLGHQPDTMYMVVHYKNDQGTREWSAASYKGEDFTTGWHTFTVEWSPEAIIWFVDGIERSRFTDRAHIPDVPMFLIANLAVGGDWPGSPNSSTPFPAVMQIDYIKVWQHASRYTPPAQTSNLLINPSFNDPEAHPWDYPWYTRNDLGAVFSQAAGGANGTPFAFKASLSKKNTSQPWVVSLGQNDRPLVAGKTYTLSFWARASFPRSLRAIVQEQPAPYNEYLAQTVNLTTGWQRYSYTFKAPASIPNAKVMFNLAGDVGDIWIDEVALEQN
jgi:beta-glucanase (GH16 family)